MKTRDIIIILVSTGMIISAIAEAQVFHQYKLPKYGPFAKWQELLYLDEDIGKADYTKQITVYSGLQRVVRIKDTTIHLTAGKLEGSLTTQEKATITHLRLTGRMDARDFRIMRDSMPVLSAIDIKDVAIATYTGTQGTAGVQDISYPAKSIPQNAFYKGKDVYNSILNAIILPTSITSISDNAFWGCKGLTGQLIIPGSVVSIGKRAFQSCGISDTLNLPNSLTSLGEFAFAQCYQLTALKLSESLNDIPKGAFYWNTSLEAQLIIPNSVTSIEDSAFANCPEISALKLSESLISIGKGAFGANWSLKGHLTIPNSVTSIGDMAFFYCGFSGLTLPDSVRYIGRGAFQKCKFLTGNISIPKSITSINDMTFALCAELKSITLPNTLTSIGNGAFAMSGLMNVILSDRLTSIKESAVSSITLPDSINSIGEIAFIFSKIWGNLKIPAKLAFIGNGAFTFSGIDGFIVENNNQFFASADGILYDKSKTSLLMYPNREGACNIPDFTTAIGDYAFDNCNSLTSVTIPASVVSIGARAFGSCLELTSVTVYSGTPIALNDSIEVFGSLGDDCTLYVPVGSKALYQLANEWKDFSNIIEMFPTGRATAWATDKKVVLYPNPTSEGFWIHAGTNDQMAVSLYNSGGVQVFISQVQDESYINIANLPKGAYVVKISTLGEKWERKLLIK